MKTVSYGYVLAYMGGYISISDRENVVIGIVNDLDQATIVIDKEKANLSALARYELDRYYHGARLVQVRETRIVDLVSTKGGVK